ncbi:MAG: hypothetical protein LBB82_08200 [Treponema sp.]|jgi:hypothetical protein|nr:hypothetical protein [Treponema sp.]
MLKFLIKKTCFDLWDHLFSMLFLNLVFIALFSLAFILPPLPARAAAGAVIFAARLFLMLLHLCASSRCLKLVSDYRAFGFADYFAALKHAFKPALVLALAGAAGGFLSLIGIPFYLALGNFTGAAAAFFGAWLLLFCAAALQFFPALYFRLESRPLYAVKKCFLVFFDNPLFCLASLAVTLPLCVLILPCPSFPLLYLDEALRVLLFKYDWLEARRGEADSEKSAGRLPLAKDPRRRKIPWKEILAEEDEKTGVRTWRDFLFPWRL